MLTVLLCYSNFIANSFIKAEISRGQQGLNWKGEFYKLSKLNFTIFIQVLHLKKLASVDGALQSFYGIGSNCPDIVPHNTSEGAS